MKTYSLAGIFAAVLIAGIFGCTDMGSNVSQPAFIPSISAIQPDSAFVGDTLRIFGANFDTAKGPIVVSVGGAIADTIYSLSETEIVVKVPASAATGNVSVSLNGFSSNALAFTLRGAVVPAISFSRDVFPIFQNEGCVGCHGGNGGLTLDTYANLMKGGSVGPVVTPFNGEGSVIVKKLRGTAGFGSRMPLGGPYLPDATIATISLWITQGAKNN